MKILINGRACTGKNQIADYLEQKYGFEQISFAKPIYDIAKDLFDMKEKDRTLLIAIGDKLREIDKDVFVKWVLRQLKPNKNYVISDCRQLNEYKLCTLEGFIPIRVTSPLELRIKRAIVRDSKAPNVEEWEGHSETGADNCQYYFEINNNSTLENLYEQVDRLLELNHFESEKDFLLPTRVRITKINDTEDASHLISYIGKEGIAYYNPIVYKGIKRWKIIFDEETNESAYFRRNEFEVIE